MTRRNLALLLVTSLVVLAHLWLTDEVVSNIAPQKERPTEEMTRMKAVYVSEMKLTAPPVAAAAPPAPAARPKPVAKPAPVALPASAPQQDESPQGQPDTRPDDTNVADNSPAVTDLDNPTPPTAASSPTDIANAPTSSPSASQPGVGPAIADAGSANATAQRNGPQFVWPQATKVNYKMEGNYRGPIYGQASVEWVRRDDRYQVHLDASVGPSFAPLGSWRLSSEGQITADGLRPSRYENANRLLVRTTPARSVTFGEEEVVLQDGQRAPRVSGLQDPVSQLIHLSYRLITHPDLLKAGNTIQMPIALLRKVEVFAYDVVGLEVLDTPIGRIPTWHLKPKRLEPSKDTISMEIWFAPGLQYLPVRLFVRQDEQTFMDMTLRNAPQLAPGEGIQPSSNLKP